MEENVRGGGIGVIEGIIVYGGVQSEEQDLGFEILDLALQLLLRLAGLLVAFFACPSVQLLELLSARMAPHSSFPS